MLSSQLWMDEELMHEELAQAVDKVLAFSGGDITRGVSFHSLRHHRTAETSQQPTLCARGMNLLFAPFSC
jgi:hypothetical protein